MHRNQRRAGAQRYGVSEEAVKLWAVRHKRALGVSVVRASESNVAQTVAIVKLARFIVLISRISISRETRGHNDCWLRSRRLANLIADRGVIVDTTVFQRV